MSWLAMNRSNNESVADWARNLLVAGLLSSSCLFSVAIAQGDDADAEADAAMEEEVMEEGDASSESEPSSRCLGIKQTMAKNSAAGASSNSASGESQAAQQKVAMASNTGGGANKGRCRGQGTGGEKADETLILSMMTPTGDASLKASGTCPGEEGTIHFVAHQNGTTLAFKDTATGGSFTQDLSLRKVLLTPGPAKIAAFCPGDEVLTSSIMVQADE